MICLLFATIEVGFSKSEKPTFFPMFNFWDHDAMHLSNINILYIEVEIFLFNIRNQIA